MIGKTIKTLYGLEKRKHVTFILSSVILMIRMQAVAFLMQAWQNIRQPAHYASFRFKSTLRMNQISAAIIKIMRPKSIVISDTE